MSLDDDTMKAIKQAVHDALIPVHDKINSNREEVTKITTTSEQLVSTLLMAYQEIAISLEIVINRLCKTKEEQEEFRNEIQTARQSMVDWMKDIGEADGVPEETLAQALGQVFEG